MMRVETISGMLYFGDVFFGDVFIRIIPKQAMVYSKEGNGYVELENLPKEIFVPIVRVEAIVEVEVEVETEEENKNEEVLKEVIDEEDVEDNEEEKTDYTD